MVQRNVSSVKFVVDCCNLDQFSGRPTRVCKMTDRGREFTIHLKRKAALTGKYEFCLQLVSFEKSIYDIGNPDFIRSELQKLKSLADNAIQGFIDSMNVTAGIEINGCPVVPDNQNYQWGNQFVLSGWPLDNPNLLRPNS